MKSNSDLTSGSNQFNQTDKSRTSDYYGSITSLQNMILCLEDMERRTDHREDKVGVPDIGVTLVTRAKRGQYVAGEEAFSFFSGDDTRLIIIVTDGI